LLPEILNLAIGRLELQLNRNQLRRQLIIKNMDLTAEDLHSLLDLGEIALDGG
jgi:hypothetical protein